MGHVVWIGKEKVKYRFTIRQTPWKRGVIKPKRVDIRGKDVKDLNFKVSADKAINGTE